MRWYGNFSKLAAWPESLGPGEEIPAAPDVPRERPSPASGMSYRVEDSAIVGTRRPPNDYDVFATFEEAKQVLTSEIQEKLERLQEQIETLRRTRQEDVPEPSHPSDM